MGYKTNTSLLEDNIGKILHIGSYEFTEDKIIRFAEKYDPQPCHLDREAVKTKKLGGICASGWHINAIWMQLNVRAMENIIKQYIESSTTPPVFGPSPGVENLRWAYPVFSGDLVAYTLQIKDIRPLASKPGWSMLTLHATGTNQYGDPVMAFDNAVLVQLSPNHTV